MSDNLKCLMIGQVGIGKTSLLKAIPNANLVTPVQESSNKETFLINSSDFLGGSADNSIEIQNVDITIETCLQENDLVFNNSVISSNNIINFNKSDVIILCFAFDDFNSLQLIRSKWDIYLKKARKDFKNQKFLLVGIKSDLAPTSKKNEKLSSIKGADIKVVYKKRSCSVNSVSSTSKLQYKKKRIISESDTPAVISNKSCKKFAKATHAKFIRVSNLETSNEHTQIFLEALNDCRKAIKASSSMTLKRTGTFKSKIPKSLSAPISTLVNRRSRKLIDAGEIENVNETHENEAKNGQENSNRFGQVIESISLKKKLSQLLTGLGTYVVTCGSKHKSRKLMNNNSKPTNDNKKSPSSLTLKASPLRNANNLLSRKNKSWLLLGSDASLNSLTNEDEVFA